MVTPARPLPWPSAARGLFRQDGSALAIQRACRTLYSILKFVSLTMRFQRSLSEAIRRPNSWGVLRRGT